MINAIHWCKNNDPEYLRILRELQRLGITPSGNKAIDKAKLEKAKEKTEERFEIFDEIEIADKKQLEREQMEIDRQGATTLAEINKILLGL